MRIRSVFCSLAVVALVGAFAGTGQAAPRTVPVRGPLQRPHPAGTAPTGLSPAGSSAYKIVDLGPGGYRVLVNDLGQVASWYGPGYGQPYVWSPWTGKRVDLPIPKPYQMCATEGFNDLGQVTGFCLTSDESDYAAVVWRGNKVQVLKSEVPGVRFSTSYDVNLLGQVAGDNEDPESMQAYAVVWDRLGRMTNLGVLPGMDSSNSWGVNDLGQVVGSSGTADNSIIDAFLWTRQSGMVDLGSLPGYPVSFPWRINDRGDIAGAAYTADFTEGEAYLWTRGAYQGLGTLGGPLSEGWGVNESRQVVGDSLTSDGVLMAFVWQRSTGIASLGMLSGETETMATSINEFGVIAGHGVEADGSYHALLWVPAGR